MEDLTFGEQVKIILGRKGMTIKQLAELIEEKTGKKMSRQNLTQRLGRDNFQEQDMRMIASILECPFRLSIMTVDAQPQRSTAALERAAAARTEAVERRADMELEQESAELRMETEPEREIVELRAETEPEQETVELRAETEPEQETVELRADIESGQEAEPAPGAGERDMTIGELYDMHRELAALEESVKAGEPVEEIRKELEKPKREGFLRGGLFLRRKQHKNTPAPSAEPEGEAQTETAQGVAADAGKSDTGKPDTAAASEENRKEETVSAQDAVRAEEVQDKRQPETDSRKEDDFEPVIPQHDAEEDAAAGEVNPYTGREYQSNSVRMHPTRIGYVQVYDRTIHKWTDMTEWAFLGLQERKKALLGKAYEPPIYLD
ncbi:hypothetical protein [Lachnoclostridium sp. An76]|uniref:hypothetical protein n=1 Tax=Lachnoclostridium sp. An76 TaxID=1965654 RepID=UPI000B39CB05|nr:hypothetical protein [Lachnoclostridium sp. An76]OUN35147.1 hypothetical protein B5G27_05755 [Lachnoclostridium sp. An76]